MFPDQGGGIIPGEGLRKSDGKDKNTRKESRGESLVAKEFSSLRVPLSN